MNKHYDNIFDIYTTKESTNIARKSTNESPERNTMSISIASVRLFNDTPESDDFFRNSSNDYFRNSSNDNYICASLTESSSSNENSNPKNVKLTSKKNFTGKDFEIMCTIGEGAYARVLKVKHKITGDIYAIKEIEKRLIEKEEKLYQCFIENEVLNLCNSPYVIGIHGIYEDLEKVYMVLEYCGKGDLSEFIYKHMQMQMDITIAKFFISQVVLTLEYLYSLNIIHRDIKPDNFVLDKEGKIKLVDFATVTFKAKIFDEEKMTFVNETEYLSCMSEDENKLKIIKKQKFVGTAEYMSPEVILGKEVTFSTDLWALGCILYQMLTGESPFNDKTQYLIFQNILNLKYNESKIKDKIALDLIKKLIVINPTDRLGTENIDDLKNHDFFKNNDEMVKTLDDFIILIKSKMKSKKSNTQHQQQIFESMKLEFIHPNSSFIPKHKDKEISKSVDFPKDFNFFPQLKLKEEKIIKIGILKKKSPWLFYDKRKLILYNTPKIEYYDPDTNILKGCIMLNKNCNAQLVDQNKFDLVTPNRIFTFMWKRRFDIAPWVLEINEAIKNALEAEK